MVKDSVKAFIFILLVNYNLFHINEECVKAS